MALVLESPPRSNKPNDRGRDNLRTDTFTDGTGSGWAGIEYLPEAFKYSMFQTAILIKQTSSFVSILGGWDCGKEEIEERRVQSHPLKLYHKVIDNQNLGDTETPRIRPTVTGRGFSQTL